MQDSMLNQDPHVGLKSIFQHDQLYRKVEEGTMGGFHDDPMTWPAGLPLPPYIVADRGYSLLS